MSTFEERQEERRQRRRARDESDRQERIREWDEMPEEDKAEQKRRWAESQKRKRDKRTKAEQRRARWEPIEAALAVDDVLEALGIEPDSINDIQRAGLHHALYDYRVQVRRTWEGRISGVQSHVMTRAWSGHEPSEAYRKALADEYGQRHVSFLDDLFASILSDFREMDDSKEAKIRRLVEHPATSEVEREAGRQALARLAARGSA